MVAKEATGFSMLWIEACHLPLAACPLYWTCTDLNEFVCAATVESGECD